MFIELNILIGFDEEVLEWKKERKEKSRWISGERNKGGNGLIRSGFSQVENCG